MTIFMMLSKQLIITGINRSDYIRMLEKIVNKLITKIFISNIYNVVLSSVIINTRTQKGLDIKVL